MDENEECYKRMITVFKNLETGFTLRWGETHGNLLGNRAILTGWVDVILEENLMELLQTGWVFTIVSQEIVDSDIKSELEYVEKYGGEPDLSVEEWQIVAKHSKTVYCIWDTELHWYDEKYNIVCELEGSPSGKMYDQQKQLVHTNPERYSFETRNAWTADDISAAIKSWLKVHTGRTDINVVPSTQISENYFSQLEEKTENLKSEELYQVGEGLYASDQVMDFLLQADKETQERLMQKLSELKSEGES